MIRCSLLPCDLTTPRFVNNSGTTVVNWVDTGVLAVWGRVGGETSPQLVLPFTVEPSKPRLCHDERFLNLWNKDLPFKLDHLADLPRYVLPGHFQTSFGDKNGYQHVLLHPSSRTFFGLEWNGVYFAFCSLPFEWNASAYITISVLPSRVQHFRLGFLCLST